MMHTRFLLTVVASAVVVAACATSPLGRDQLILFPDEKMSEMGAVAYRQLKEQAPVSKQRAVNRYVACVADSVTGMLGGADAGDWEVTVFAEDQVNAFALPGKKIGIYEGLLDVAENQHQLAAVIAHEVAHVLARHGNERISTQYAASAGLDLVSIAAGSETPLKRSLLGLLGVGTQVGVLLPFSRAQETEADLLGLELMSKAGFDPAQSIDLWRNMARESSGAPPEFLSTHPSGDTRIRELQAYLPKVRPLVQSARAAGRSPDCRD